MLSALAHIRERREKEEREREEREKERRVKHVAVFFGRTYTDVFWKWSLYIV